MRPPFLVNSVVFGTEHGWAGVSPPAYDRSWCKEEAT
jgi:hypothetical protein